MPTQKQRSEATRELLVDAFRQSLLNKGLEATTTAGVLAETGLSKGALYHHFPSKNDIVEAIYRADSHGAIRRSLDSVPAEFGPSERLKRGCENWLKEMRKRETGRIVLDLGPQALGLERVIAIESELSLRLFGQILEEAVQAGELSLSDTRLAARLINALMTELAIAKPTSQRDPISLVAPLIDGILAGLSVSAKAD